MALKFDDYEEVLVAGKYFDLALRKFITGVETNGKIENIDLTGDRNYEKTTKKHENI